MSYAQAKEIVLLRQTLRACWEAGDRAGGLAALAQLTSAAATRNDNELVAETRRWAIKLG